MIIDTNVFIEIINEWSNLKTKNWTMEDDKKCELATFQLNKIKKLEEDYKTLYDFAQITISNNALGEEYAKTNLLKEETE